MACVCKEADHMRTRRGLGSIFFVLILLALGIVLLISWPFRHEWGTTVRLLLAAVGLCLILLLWWAPRWQVAHSEGLTAENRFDRENEARKTLAQIIGGVFLLAGIYTSVKTFDLQRQTEYIQEQGQITQQQGQITDRFTKAIDQLGSRGKEVRLGGIYALGRLAKDSHDDRWAIMEVLTAYVREHAQKEKPECDKIKLRQFPTDIQAVLSVIGRDGQEVVLKKSNGGPACSTAAQVEGQKMNLSRTGLFSANLIDLHLEGADINEACLSGADLGGAHLNDAILTGADLDGRIGKTSLTGVELRRARLDQADFTDSDLSEADLQDACFDGTDLSGAKLQGAHLEGADLEHAILNPRQLEGTTGDDRTRLPAGISRPKSWKH
jgi:uncharacterized protein YjbI with pentapeptide repeats